MFKKSILIFSTLIILNGCAVQRKPPEWLDGKNSFHQSRYIKGIGIGDTRNSAKNNAIAEIGKIFKVKVESMTRDRQQHESESGDAQRLSEIQTIEQETKTSTDIFLSGVEVAEYWLNPDNKKYYALATLDKRKRVNEIMGELNVKFEKISSWMDLADSSDDIVKKVKYYYSSVREIKDRNSLHNELRILDAEPPVYSRDFIKYEDLIKKYEESISILKVGIAIKGDPSNTVKAAVLEVLNNFGLSPVEIKGMAEEENVDMIVKGVINNSLSDRLDKQWRYYRGEGEIRIVNSKTKEVIKTINVSSREGHLTELEAEKKSLKMLTNKIKEALRKEISSFFSTDD